MRYCGGISKGTHCSGSSNRHFKLIIYEIVSGIGSSITAGSVRIGIGIRGAGSD